MNRDTKRLGLPSLIGDLFDQSELQIDNVFASLRNQLYIATLLPRVGLHKRLGAVTQVVYLLLLWVWLKVDSTDMISRKTMQSFSDARKDFIYDYLKREDVNWRRLHYQIARLLKKCFSGWIESFISVRRVLLSLSDPFVMVAAMWQNTPNRYLAHEEG